MLQLSLFDEPALPSQPLEPPDAQLSLFDQRGLGLARVSEALRHGDVDGAASELRALCLRLPHDTSILEHARDVEVLRRHLRHVSSLAPLAQPQALLVVARGLFGMSTVYREFGRLLTRRAAEQWRVVAGDAALLDDGKLPGEILLENGDFAAAEASLRAAAHARPNGRTLFRWGDVTGVLGSAEEARRIHRDALLCDPFDIAALSAVRDAEVRALMDLAESEIGIEEEPLAWSAPVGIVLGILPRPLPAERAVEWPDPDRSPSEVLALRHARAFVAVHARLSTPEVRRSGEATLAARRTLKDLCPALFRVVLRGGCRG